MDALRVALLDATGSEGEEAEAIDVDQVLEHDRPVVFVIDSETEGFQVWGETKLAGNTSRYGLPPGQIDQGYLYLGSLQNFMQGRPTSRGGGAVPAGECGADELGKDTYNCLSKALLADTQAGIERAGTNPVEVVAGIFNETGANVDEATRQRPLGTPLGGNTEVLAVSRGEVTPLQGAAGSSSTANPGFGASPLHLLRVLAGFLLMLVPGAVALRWFLPGATLAEALGMAPALSVALLSVAGMAILAVVRSPFSPALAWGGLGICALAATMTAIFGHSGSLLLRREKPATAS